MSYPPVILSSDLPGKITLHLDKDLKTIFHIISSTELSADQRKIDVEAYYKEQKTGYVFRHESSVELLPADRTGDLWIYDVPLSFVQVKRDVPHEYRPGARFILGDGDGTLSISGGVQVEYGTQIYYVTNKAISKGAKVGAPLPDQFISAAPNGFKDDIDVDPGTGAVDRNFTVYLYFEQSIDPGLFWFKSLTIERPFRSKITIPGKRLDFIADTTYTDPGSGTTWDVYQVKVTHPRRGTGTIFPVGGGDSTLTFTSLFNAPVYTDVTFNGSID